MSLSPHEVVERLVAWVPERRWTELPSLYEPAAVVELPLALPAPIRLTGREALAGHFAAAGKLPLAMRAENLRIHDTTDPEVVVAEFDYLAHHTQTGREFTVANVFIVRVRHGLIVRSRDYSNHIMFAAAFDRLEGLVASLGSPD
jgi:ketosteroid isomerase-like protein